MGKTLSEFPKIVNATYCIEKWSFDITLNYNTQETKCSFLEAKMHGMSLAVKCRLELAISKSFRPIQKFGVIKICVFESSPLCSTKQHLFESKHCKKVFQFF